MPVIRAFIAIELPPNIQQRLEQVSQQLQQTLAGFPIRWVPASNMHLTLKFLGDVSEANLKLLKEMLLSEAASHCQHELSIGGFGAYPSMQRPRVLWVGVEAPQELAALQAGIESRTVKLGYPREDRPFSPHLTLGRISRSATNQEVRKIGEHLPRVKIGFMGVVPVREIRLYQSVLKPGGAEYTPLFTASLAIKP